MGASTRFWDRIAERYTRKPVADAGFEIDHRWQPGKGKAVFIVAKKPRA